jgi:hypothetical protein
MRELSKNPFPSVEQIIRNGPREYMKPPALPFSSIFSKLPAYGSTSYAPWPPLVKLMRPTAARHAALSQIL